MDQLAEDRACKVMLGRSSIDGAISADFLLALRYA